MKIAVLSDLHGNFEAWAAVRRELNAAQITKVWVLGDVCGYYYDTRRILEELVQFDFEFIRGNHEDILSGLQLGTINKDFIKRKYGSGHSFCQDQLTDEQMAFLTDAPTSNTIDLENMKFFLCHGSPLNQDEYLYPDTARTRLNECHVQNCDFVFVGHSHYQFAHSLENSVLINPGSVGQSRQRGGSADWAVVNTSSKTFQLLSTPYNAHGLIQRCKEVDPELLYLRTILTRNTHEKEL